MRVLAAILTLAAVAGCSTAPTSGKGVLSETTDKSPEQYAQCLTPKWQKFDPKGEQVAIDNGYRITVSAPFTASPTYATVTQQGNGSQVVVDLPPDWAGTTGWVELARSCL